MSTIAPNREPPTEYETVYAERAGRYCSGTTRDDDNDGRIASFVVVEVESTSRKAVDVATATAAEAGRFEKRKETDAIPEAAAAAYARDARRVTATATADKADPSARPSSSRSSSENPSDEKSWGVRPCSPARRLLGFPSHSSSAEEGKRVALVLAFDGRRLRCVVVGRRRTDLTDDGRVSWDR